MRRSRRPRPSREAGFAVAACAALAAYNNLISRHPWHHRRYARLNLGATGAVLSAAAASGLSPADLGFGPGRWRPGRPALGLAAGAAAGWMLVAAVPAARPVLDDRRIGTFEGRAIAYNALVRIPVGTVLWEEVAFRGVLQAALRRTMPPGAAMAVTAGVFGLWHVRPALEALRANGLVAAGRGRGQAVLRVSAVCFGMTACGMLLSWLRARSGSLTAPVLLHLAVNSGGLVAAWAVAGQTTGLA